MSPPDLLVRKAAPNELNLIYSTWLNSYRSDSSVGKNCRTSIFFEEYPAVIDRILARDTTQILVACFQDSPELVLAYLVYEPGILHYAFTKEIYRNNGIARELFQRAFGEALSIQITHRTFTVEYLLQERSSRFHFNPFKLYDRLESGGKKDV